MVFFEDPIDKVMSKLELLSRQVDRLEKMNQAIQQDQQPGQPEQVKSLESAKQTEQVKSLESAKQTEQKEQVKSLESAKQTEQKEQVKSLESANWPQQKKQLYKIKDSIQVSIGSMMLIIAVIMGILMISTHIYDLRNYDKLIKDKTTSVCMMESVEYEYHNGEQITRFNVTNGFKRIGIYQCRRCELCNHCNVHVGQMHQCYYDDATILLQQDYQLYLDIINKKKFIFNIGLTTIIIVIAFIACFAVEIYYGRIIELLSKADVAKK